MKHEEISSANLRRMGLALWLFVLLVFVLTFCGTAVGEDWPAHRHDNRRSGATAEQLEPPLVPAWVHSTNRRPRPAWDETPAPQNFWGGTYDHRSRVNVDQAFHVAVAGDSVYFGSSNSNKVVCLDAANGSQRWKFFTGGPVRFAPTAAGGKVYFGSDDGYAYCLNAADGSLVWKSKAAAGSELMFVNGRMVSACPVRTGVLVDNGVAYWGAGLLAGAQTGLNRYICASNAENGAQIWKISPPKPIQGYPLASSGNLYMPAGKSNPTYYRKSNGAYLGSIGSSRQGGAYALISNDNKLFFGPHYAGGGSYIAKHDATTGAYEKVAWGPGNYLVVTDDYSYYSSDTVIVKIRRSNQSTIWTAPSSHPYELILAGETLFAGADDEVAAIGTSNGGVSWTAPVKGRVRGLAVANGRLFVSTDLGAVHCFRPPHPGDLDVNGDINWADFARFAPQWRKTGCGDCGGADLAGNDGRVDGRDLKVIADGWMAE